MWQQRERIRALAPRGFTLLELLIVIAILTLLVSLLLPALSLARESAKGVICTANLRHIAQAWQLYLQDNEDTLPIWEGNMHWFYGGKHPAICNTDRANSLEYRPLNPYIDMLLQNESGIGLFRCASDRPILNPSGGVGVTRGHDTYDYFGNCYMMNPFLLYAVRRNGRRSYTRPFHVKKVQIPPSELVLAGDCQWYYTVGDYPWDAHFHNYEDRMAMVFLDGHASFMQLTRGSSVTSDYSFWPYDWWPEEE